MDRTVARLNVEHYRRLLARETDEARRQVVMRLLAEEKRSQARRFQAPGALAGCVPVPPMGRAHVQPLLGFRVHPAAENAPAGKHQRMRPVIVDDGQLKVAGEWRGGDTFPH